MIVGRSVKTEPGLPQVSSSSLESQRPGKLPEIPFFRHDGSIVEIAAVRIMSGLATIRPEPAI
jgi:hypothetical protein